MTNQDQLLTLPEVGARLRLAPKTLLGWVADGKLRATKVGRRWLVASSEVERVLGPASNGGAS